MGEAYRPQIWGLRLQMVENILLGILFEMDWQAF
jgi:hypothetical protein